MIGLIGCGNMGAAIIKGAITNGAVTPADVCVYDISKLAIDKMIELGVEICVNNREVVSESDVIILATKPQYIPEVLADLKDVMNDKALISIAAGITTKDLKEMTNSVRILRVMPNTPALVGEGAAAFSLATDFTKEEKALAGGLFAAIGTIEWIAEELMDVISGFSGAGPAYVAMILEAMSDAAVKQGLPRVTAYRLAAQTLLGSAKLFMESGMNPSQMKDMVTSPGGVTIVGVEALERGGLRYAIMNCIDAATEKAMQMRPK
ncbi:pyrroline-5-carboxylate reductase [Candidatus Epulonipiscium viviparus]|uniref:pyrroline-5-carboxylate reductase n=1 Tax=Candidatus Epulonipiscium viviparus TaxID=420336 RepID=UPI00273815E2|nr:pyrroline-5-carboxylate reductase [Candidatus Epulopiscium viviparus]